MRTNTVFALTLSLPLGLALGLACESKPAAPAPAPASQPAAFTPKPVKLKDSSLPVLSPAQPVASLAGPLDAALADYLVLKDALVRGDETTARAAAKAAKDKLMTAKATPEVDATWTAQAKVIGPALDAMIAEGSTLAVQREQLSPLSEGLFTAARSFGAGKGLNIQYCPMALNNTGAYWLSKEREIANPYYGAMMLRCGGEVARLGPAEEGS